MTCKHEYDAKAFICRCNMGVGHVGLHECNCGKMWKSEDSINPIPHITFQMNSAPIQANLKKLKVKWSVVDVTQDFDTFYRLSPMMTYCRIRDTQDHKKK